MNGVSCEYLLLQIVFTPCCFRSYLHLCSLRSYLHQGNYGAIVNLGAAKVVADYTTNPISTWELEETTWENTVSEWDNGGPVIFNLYIDKTLWYTKELIDSNTFRLPAGYKTDTFEIEIKSALRVRSIHLAETPIALRTV